MRKYMKAKGETCAVEGCSNDVLAVGICAGHYTQKRAGRDFSPLKLRRAGRHVKDGKKYCQDCQEWLPLGDFYMYGADRSNYFAYCKPCYQKRQGTYREKSENTKDDHKERVRASRS